MNERRYKAYCHIIGCPNNLGTVDKEQAMFRLPSKVNRTQWIEAIAKHQPETGLRTVFNVCMHHFLEDEYEKKNGRFVLKPNAVPSVFDAPCHFVEIISDEIIQEIEVDSANKCVQCPCLLDKIEELKYELQLLKTKHDATVARLEERHNELKIHNSAKCAELKKIQTERTKLQRLLSEMRSENVISDTDERFLCEFDMREVVECLYKGMKGTQPYPPSVRAFCLSLHFTSPRAYEYIRDKFGRHLPHAQTLRQWYRNSNLDASSGINHQALNALESLS